MPEMHLKQPGFIYGACGSFTKIKERILKFKETGDSRYIYQNELDKAFFQHDMAYGDFKDITRRTLIKYYVKKAFNIAKNEKCDGYQRELPSMAHKFFDKKTSGGAATLANKSAIKNENISNKELEEELHKPIIRNFNKRKVQSPFIDNICGADLADMQLVSKSNKGFRFLLCVIDIYSKYACFIPLKDKKGIIITNVFQKILNESNRKQIKIWVDKGSEFCNRSMKSWLEKNGTEVYSTHNEGKFAVAERFIRTL